MRIINKKDSEGRPHLEFSDSFGNVLTQSQLSHLGVSHLEKVHLMLDSHKNILAYKMKEYDKYGAISIKGEKYADFIYESFEGVTRSGYGSIGDDNQQELWMGKKDGDLYDIYHRYDLIFEDAVSARLIVDSATNNEYNIRYAQIATKDGYKVYDIYDSCFLNFTAKDAISYIDSEKRQVITDKSRLLPYLNTSRRLEYEYTSTLMDFDGNILGTFVELYYLRFTPHPNLFTINRNGKIGVVKFTNGVMEEVIPPKYHKITQFFDDKVVAINSQNCVKIVHFEKKNKKGVDVWTNKLDSYKLPKEVVAGFFLEDESEGILTLSNGMKILFSLYMQGKTDEQYQCEDIFYEGNAIFKCFQFKGKEIATITYMCNGQAVDYNSNERDGHLVEIGDSAVRRYMMFTPYGAKIDIDARSYQTLSRMYGGQCFNVPQTDFMRIQKDGRNNLVKHNSYDCGNHIVNLYKGTIHKYHYSDQLIWHNVYYDSDKYDLHLVDGEDSIIKPVKNLTAAFDEYAVFSAWNCVYLFDRKFNVTKYDKANVRVDEVYEMAVITTTDEAIVVFNNGIEKFNSTGRTIVLPQGAMPIYKSATSGNYVVGNLFVDANLLKYEAIAGTIDKSLATL